MQHLSERFDFAAIANWITRGASVLDLGSGNGALLAYLQQHLDVRGYGIELNPDNVTACIKNGVNVLQLDLERGLRGFDNHAFDDVIMSLSLQTVHNTEFLLKEMLRVGREAIVSFPNFGYKAHRESIARGLMPVSKHLPYQWYDTPNVRFFTMDDFAILCERLAIRQVETLAFNGDKPVNANPNLEADVALIRLAPL